MESIILSNSKVSNIEPLSVLLKLKDIYLDKTQVSNLESLKELENLNFLVIRDCNCITDEQIDDLQKALPELKIYR